MECNFSNVSVPDFWGVNLLFCTACMCDALFVGRFAVPASFLSHLLGLPEDWLSRLPVSSQWYGSVFDKISICLVAAIHYTVVWKRNAFSWKKESQVYVTARVTCLEHWLQCWLKHIWLFFILSPLWTDQKYCTFHFLAELNLTDKCLDGVLNNNSYESQILKVTLTRAATFPNPVFSLLLWV